MFPSVKCPICGCIIPGPFPSVGCNCGFNLSGLAGVGASKFQVKKDPQHRDILYGRSIQLYGKPYNASFDYYGDVTLVDLVRFGLTYGERQIIPSLHGNNPTEVIVSYIPDVIGSGISKLVANINYPCSGICLMSPSSTGGYDHSFPFLDGWVTNRFSGQISTCRFCSRNTPFGIGICDVCFAKNGNQWKNFIDPNYPIIV